MSFSNVQKCKCGLSGLLLSTLMSWALPVTPSQAQAWEAVYGGLMPETAYSVCSAPDSGAIMIGTSCSYGRVTPRMPNIHIVKTLRGQALPEWATTIHAECKGDLALRPYPDSAGTLVWAAGAFHRRTASLDFIVGRLSALGLPIWTRALGGMAPDAAADLLVSRDGSIVVVGAGAGVGGSDVLVARLASDGTPLWTYSYGSSGRERAWSVVEDARNGRLYLCGEITRSGREDSDVLLLCLRADGRLRWARAFGGDYNDYAYALAGPGRPFLVLAGLTWSARVGAGGDAMALAVTASGSLRWGAVYGSMGHDAAYDLLRIGRDSIVMAGESSAPGGSKSSGLLLWLHPRRGTLSNALIYGGAEHDCLRSLAPLQSTGRRSGRQLSYAAGRTYSFSSGDSDKYLLRFSDSAGAGTLLCGRPLPLVQQDFDPQVSSPAFVTLALSDWRRINLRYSRRTNFRPKCVFRFFDTGRLSQEGNADVDDEGRLGMLPTLGKEKKLSIHAFPNPLGRGNQLTVHVVPAEVMAVNIGLVNILGLSVFSFSGWLRPGLNEFKPSSKDLAAGTYLLRVESVAGIQSQAIVIVK